jgi:ketosteroid isomerase-like protein
VTLSHIELYHRYVYHGAMRRDADAVAAMFADDGFYEAPLVPLRFDGREAIRAGVAAMHADAAYDGVADTGLSRYTIHETGDPDVFVAEIDAVLDRPGGERITMSLVQIFRRRGDEIASLRDYFTAP